MNAERRQKIEQLYRAVMEHEPGERAAFLRDSVPDDELRRELQSLIVDGRNLGEIAESRLNTECPLKPGVLVGPYRIVERLGSGGLGDVYRATDTRLRRSVAIKIIRDRDENWRQRFIHEARAASALNHANIVTAYDVSSDHGVDFLVMEYINGRTLDRVIAGKPMQLSVALEYASQIAEGLAAAHAAGIIHRDLKPGNIMITSEGVVKILDFGLAKFTIVSGADEAEITRTLGDPTREGLIVGTAAYMSPEQAMGKLVDPRSDLFSFGVVLYEMLSGQRAFSNTSTANVLAAIVHSEPLPIRSVAPDTPPALERLLNKCLAKSPDGRWQTAIDLKDELDWTARDSGHLTAEPPPGRQRFHAARGSRLLRP